MDEPSDPIRFLSRADLGEKLADHPAPPVSDLPFATREERSALPFPSKPPSEPDWGLDEVSGVPLGLPKLLADDLPEDVPESAGPPPAPPPPSDIAGEPEPSEALPDDVFALSGEEDELADEHSDEWTREQSAQSEVPEAAPPPAEEPPTAAPAPADELQALRDEVAALQGRVWMAAIAGAVVGGVLTALVLLSL